MIRFRAGSDPAGIAAAIVRAVAMREQAYRLAAHPRLVAQLPPRDEA